MKRRPGHASVEEHPKGSGLMDVFSALLQPEPIEGKAWFALMRRQNPGARHVHVYFIQCNGDKGPIKIGLTRDLEQRMRHLRLGNPYPLVRLASEVAPVECEAKLHKRFKKYRIQGEWFRASETLLAFVNQLRAAA